MTADSTTPDNPRLGPIVALDSIHHELDRIVLCDVRWYLDGRSGRAAYLEGHIPGALFVDLDQDLSAPELAPMRGRHPWPPAQQFTQHLGDLGISPTDPVVAYDDGGGTSAGRLVWMLRAIGHDAALLDGGLAAWPGQLETAAATRSPVDYPATDWFEDRFVDADTAGATAARSAGARVFDVRSPERYRGESEPMDARAGHVPGAINLYLGGNTDTDGFFLPRDQLARRFAEVGVRSPDSAIIYCGSGVSACQTLLAMEHAGVGRQRLFPGSWSEWSWDENRPVATGPD